MVPGTTRFIALLNSFRETLPLNLSEQQITLLADYLARVVQARESHRLTSITDEKTLVYTFVIRPLMVLHTLRSHDLLTGGKVYDLGSGGGVPGMAMAIALPELAFVLVERSTTRALFLQSVVSSLSLRHVLVYEGDAIHLMPLPEEWVVTQGVNLVRKPLRRHVSKWVDMGVHLAWITIPRKARTVRFAGRYPQLFFLENDPFVIAMW